uniref:Uncharacterized protein n=1 Tax=Panagrolaimus sp. PS1159 TaxID=55785 RepID=A0AC35GA90_9BILA
MPPKVQQNKSQYYEGKWDKIVMKMLRTEVAKNPVTGADLAKGLDFYFHAAMEFAKQLEHEFQISEHEQEKRIPSTHHMKSTISSSAKLVEVPQPHLVTKKPNKVSEMVDGYEQKNFSKAINEEKDFGENDRFVDLSKQNLSTIKRPSLQLESAKIPVEKRFASAASTPIDNGITKAVVIENPLRNDIDEETNQPLLKEKKTNDEIFLKTTENPIPIKPSEPETKTNVPIIPQPIKEDVVPSNKSKFVPEISKPAPQIQEHHKVEPKFEPPRQRVRVGAICMDGWHSSSTGRGTCSHHGGVREWLYE